MIMRLEIAAEEWPKLTQFIEEFAKTHAMSLRNDEDRTDAYLSICNDAGLTIKAWRGQTSVFERQPHSGWERTTKDLVDKLESLWPGRLRFPAPKGGSMPRPEELQ